MSPSHVLALDQGTTGSRALVVDDGGRVRSRAYVSHAQHYLFPGWVEHDPEELWANLQGCAQRAVADAGLRPGDIAAIGLTNQRETALIWERATGRPVHNAIVWQDRRTAEACRSIKATGVGTLIEERTGLLVDPYFSATKLAWLLDHVAGSRQRAARGELCAGTIDSWIIWKISGGARHVTEATNASRTSLMDLRRLEWDEELLGLFRVPREILADIVPSSVPFVDKGATSALLSSAAPPLTGVLGDQQAALFAQACFERGQAKATFGTGTFVLGNCGATLPLRRDGLLATVAAPGLEEVRYALEGAILSTGSATRWLVDGLGLIGEPSETEALARGLDGNDDVWFVPALAGLGSPHWDPSARGTLLGVTGGTTRAHLARAVLEGIAHVTCDVLDAMTAAGSPVTELRVDGRAAGNRWLVDQVSDLSGVVVDVAGELETTALGAAYLAGLRAGLWRDEEEVAGLRRSDRRVEPTLDAAPRAVLRARWAEALERSKGWARSGEHDEDPTD